MLPLTESLLVLKKYLPFPVYTKLKTYITCSDIKRLKFHLNWNQIHTKISAIDFENCSNDLMILLNNNKPTDQNVMLFHINKNNIPTKCTEPNVTNTEILIYKFLSRIYQRNIMATLIKYILLRNIINQFQIGRAHVWTPVTL